MKTYLCVIFALCIALLSCERGGRSGAIAKIDGYFSKAETPSIPQHERLKYLDSAAQSITTLKNDSLTRNYYRKVSAKYFNLRDYKKSLLLSRKISSLSKEAGDTIGMGKGAYLQGLAYYELGVKDTALIFYKDAENYYKSINYPDLSSVIMYKAYVLHDVGEYVLCESEASVALKLFREQNKNYEIYQCLVVIASALNEQQNFEESIYYYKQALDQIEKFSSKDDSEDNREFFRVICYHNIGSVYEKRKEYDQAIAQYKIGLKSTQAPKGSELYVSIIESMAKAKMLKGELAGVKDMLNEALFMSDTMGNTEGLMRGSIYLANYYEREKDTSKAMRYYKKGYFYANEINSNPDKLKTLERLGQIDREESFLYAKEYVSLNDSLQTIALKNRNKYARIQYETDQLKDEKDALVRKNSFIIGLSVVVLLFVAAIFIIYYLNSRNKELVMLQEQQKANEEIYQLMFEQQERVESARSEEKNRIAMELHDGILNNIYAVRLNLEFSNRKSDDETVQKRKGYIKELQSLEAEIRSVSHDLSRSAKLVQGKDFADMLFFLVNTQKNNFGTHFELHLDNAIDWLAMPNTHKVNIYRIVQESLQNVNKYSHAKNAFVDIRKDGEKIVVNVHDDGVGFDTKAAAGGIGLKNLRQRTQSLNGVLRIDSSPGEGANINVQFAL
ncbi:ATP-binding protein [Flavobacterium sp. RHBU_3]|uniref:tetratricopeptide repeat-containing sensor histidine kinase n=1 Tax=Flavobacterium sp. RHBU_3 TaxID=3391184 RepID=UPI003985508B